MEEIQAFLQAIPSAAASPLALIAYLATVAAWVAIALRVKRFRVLMEKIDALPEKDRLRAIEAEIGRIKVRPGLTAEEYLRSRIHLFILIGFLAVCCTIVLVTGTAVVQVQEEKERADGYTRELLGSPASPYMSAINTLANGTQMIGVARQDVRPPMTNSELDDAVDKLVQQGLNANQINARLAEIAGTAKIRRANDALAKAAAAANDAFKKLSDCFRDARCRPGDEFARMCRTVRQIQMNLDAINTSAAKIPGVNFNASDTTAMLGGGSMDTNFNKVSAPNVAYLAQQACPAP